MSCAILNTLVNDRGITPALMESTVQWELRQQLYTTNKFGFCYDKEDWCIMEK